MGYMGNSEMKFNSQRIYQDVEEVRNVGQGKLLTLWSHHVKVMYVQGPLRVSGPCSSEHCEKILQYHFII